MVATVAPVQVIADQPPADQSSPATADPIEPAMKFDVTIAVLIRLRVRR
ncbi:MAG: hypothetical protein ACR2N4_14395 [Jatrophihabitans sp.]